MSSPYTKIAFSDSAKGITATKLNLLRDDLSAAISAGGGTVGPPGPAGPTGPQGPAGPTGPAGTAATATAGTTTTGAPGTAANVTNVGTTAAAVFNFLIPRGDVGATGPAGPTGPQGPAGTGTGDMLKSVYDTNNNGVVDTAEAIPWTGVTGKPATFAPSAHQASHITGTDQIPNASTTARGLLNQVSGLSTDYVGGDNQCHPMPVSGATLQTAAASPTGTTSTTGVMAGLGGIITPVRNGKIAVTICGFGASSAVSGAFQVSIRYGTGTAPANGAAAVGTAIGGTARGQSYAANGYTSFSVSAVITGLTLGTPIWIDLLQQSVIVAGTASLITTAISAFELP